jgi:hypothetical protein
MHSDVIFQPRRRRRLLLAGAGASLLLFAGCGSSSKPKASASPTASAPLSAAPASTTSTTQTSTSSTTTGAGVVTGSAGAVTASMHPAAHHPKVNVPWPITFTVTDAGRPAKASVSYEYLFAGQVVARRSHYTFVGHFADVFHWPSSAVGYPLTFRAVIASAGATIDLDYPVQVTA